jgi:lysophospholipid hydrolase
MSFNKFEEIEKQGYTSALEMLDKWNEEGRLVHFGLSPDGQEETDHGRKKGRSARRNSI